MRGKLYIQRTKSGGQVKKPTPIPCNLTLDGGEALAFADGKYMHSIIGKLTRHLFLTFLPMVS